MGLPRACTLACSLVLLLSVSSVQSIAADEPAAVTGATGTLTATATVGDQSLYLAYADIIAPEFTRPQPVPQATLFAQPTWLMPLPDFSTHALASKPNMHKPKSVAVPSHAANVATLTPDNASPDRPAAPMTPERDAEPFGLLTSRAPQGLLWVKWRKVRRAIETEAPALARCRTVASRCSQAAARFVAIIDEAAKQHGRARLELVNQRINYAIRYVSDRAHWHRADVWSAPLDRHHTGSFETGMGDCEDYAIAKYAALRDAGTPARDLSLLVVRDKSARSYHAVLAARLNGQWLLLDNRWRRLIPDHEARYFKPLFALNTAGVERFTAVRARASNHRTPVRRAAAKAPGRTTLAGELGPTPGSA